MTRVSVVMPVYNGAPHVEHAVASVLAQTLVDIDVAVVDNCSTDATAALLEKFDDPRLTIHSPTDHVGAPANWNRAVACAKAPYIKLLCADDVLYPDCLEKQAEILDRNASVVLVASKRDIVDEDDNVLIPGRGLGRLRGRVSGSAALRHVVRSGSNPLGEPEAVLLRREAVAKAGPFRDDMAFMLDIDMWCRVLEHGDLYALPEVVGAFRVSGASWSTRIATTQRLQSQAFVRRVRAENPALVTALDERIGLLRATTLSYARRGLYVGLNIRSRVRQVRGPKTA